MSELSGSSSGVGHQRFRDLQSGHVELVLPVSMVLYKMCGSAVYLVSSFPEVYSWDSGCTVVQDTSVCVHHKETAKVVINSALREVSF